MMLFFLIISLAASIVGAICGIGGGVIIKPLLDVTGLATVATSSFLSGCTVLAMSCYSVGKLMISGESRINMRRSTPLVIGSIAGGFLGSQLFSLVQGLFDSPDTAGAVQAGCLLVVTLGTLLYTMFKDRFHTLDVKNDLLIILIGIFLGTMSSFLGIGGGPINLVILFYFFSMETKTASQNSLYVILFSQISNLVTTLVTHSVPDFEPISLILMIAGGIGGGIIGRALSKRMDNSHTDKLLMALMVVIMGVCVYNMTRFLA